MSRDVKPEELHRRHAAHDSKNKGWRIDVEGTSWRPEGSASVAVKRAMALRLAVCWNICEGIPTDALLAGVVRDCFTSARALVDAIEKEPGLFTAALRAHAETFKGADRALGAVTTDVDCNCADHAEPADET